MPIKRVAQFLLGIPLTIVSLYFIGNFILKDQSQILSYSKHFNQLPFAAGIVLLLVFFFFRSLLWREVLEKEGYPVDTAKSTYLLSSSEIKRYIPGSILAFVSRINNFNFLNVPTKTIVRLIFYESIIFLVTSIIAAIPGFVFLVQNSYKLPPVSNSLILFLQILTVLIFLILPFFIFFSPGISKKIYPVFQKMLLFKKAFVFMFISWLFFGLGNYLLAVSFVYLDPYKIIELCSLFVLSWLIGYVTVITPLGLGVREAVTTYGLSFIIPTPLAATISILLRIGLVLSELIFFGLSYFFFRIVKIKEKLSFHTAALWTFIVSYIFYFTYVSFERHLNFFTGRFDLGNMDQTIWNTLNGSIFQLTNPDGTGITSRLSIHADFILVLLSPFYLLWRDPRTLLLIQTVVIALGAYFTFKIADLVLKNKNIALVFAVSYLLNPFVQKQNLFDFHAVTLATTFLLAAFYYLLTQKNYLFLLFIFLSVLTKENVYLIPFLFGIYLAAKTKNKKWLILSFFSLVAFLVLVTKLIPQVRGGVHFASEYFMDFGDSPMQIIKNVLLNPIKTFSQLLTRSNIYYLYQLLLPLGFLSLLSPLFLIFASPDLVINMLSKNENLKSITFHYAAIIIPFIYLAAIYGVKNLLKLKFKYLNFNTLTFLIVIFALFSTFEFGALPGSKNPSLEIYTNYLPERNDISSFLERIPDKFSVASSNNLGAHLSHRKNIYTVPNGVDKADVIVLLLNDVYAQPSLFYQRQLVKKLKVDQKYVEVYQVGDFYAFSKKEVTGRLKK